MHTCQELAADGLLEYKATFTDHVVDNCVEMLDELYSEITRIGEKGPLIRVMNKAFCRSLV
jgi:hypothetical protein